MYSDVRLPNGEIVRIKLPYPQNDPIDSRGITVDGRYVKPLPVTSEPKTKFGFWSKLWKKRWEMDNKNL